ncbi:probable ADP-ribosylation factor GTPase-activating protein AGD14 [Coffea eugenioides]|uniref:probable ADP-ribosylation factor GTPase-activating protein AGD14 n=1 Tax=Coffea eugenioides TaxID=49369 RepID=UPI000F606685|nr:probable ADP-ribosylation factor GTPase-activating protein AGD14 [Coffea eugenioides]
MSSRKEDEKNERIIRNLLKLPDNRRCINCNSLGPQYVCVNFWTFVCTNCSGIHREFTHRVKSISMAKFTSQEVSALQGAGNASAKEIYLKEWDPHRQSLPDGSNVERLRDFIKHVYVERRYSGERIFEKPPRVKVAESEDSQENRRIGSFQSGSQSPPYDDEHRYSDRPSPGGRSPGYDQDHRQYDKRSPARTEVVNDWRREDRFGNGRRSEDIRVSDGGSKLGSRSPDHQRDLDVSSPPVVRPVRDILGENVSPLRVLEPPKANDPKSADVSTRTQRTASSSSLASSNGNPAEIKIEASLIDFDAAPELPVPAPVQPQQSAASASIAQTATPSSDNWANFDSVAEVKASQPRVNSNPLESVLSQLSVPASVSGHVAVTPGIANNSTASSTGNPAAAPGPVASLRIPAATFFVPCC